ncbi:dNA gyrase/topoisomerase IV A subunit [Eggerthella sp. CAG:368]|nr:dNA gyrase/topoisomerase IV A subunit [Eggerthella sp. CAG:368]
MAKRKPKTESKKKQVNNPNVIGLHSEVTQQPITQTLESNYMPYAMSTNVSRAFPEIDGFKPSHRKLLFTMYKMGLLKGDRQKSANIVGQTMKLNPHGDSAIYETMVRLATGNEALLAPFVESKGNFGKYYSGDLSYAASRYTEAKLAPICAEIFKDIDKDPVDFVDSYDGAMKEPRLLPTTFPNILVSSNKGIGVAMASDICGFNLNEVCTATIHFLEDPECDLLEYMPMPDFSTGGEIIYRREEMERIFETGLGSFQIRSRWRYLPKERIIEVYEIPYTTKTDVIIERIIKLSKEGKVREITDIRDETDLSGLRIAIDLKRGVDPEQLMAKLFRSTTLQDSFSCNFNVLVDGYPRVMGVRQILHEWVAWRIESTRRRMNFDLNKKTERLHLLHGLEAILLDIDKAIAIIRNTKLESEVVPNLMKGFGIDEVQAEFVAELKLRNINEEYILNRTKDIERLEADIAELNDTLASESKIKKVISDELAAVNKKHVMPRRTGKIDPSEVVEVSLEPEVEEYPVTMMLSREGYLKKMTDRVLKKASSLKYKDGDGPFIEFPSSNTHELLVFTDRSQVYKCKIASFEDTKSAQLGSYLSTDLEMDPDESVTWVIDPEDYKADVLFVFENGRVARVALAGYATKTNRKRLKNAIYGGSKLLYAAVLKEERDLALVSSDYRLMNFNTSLLKTKTTTSTQGVQAFTVKGSRTVTAVGKAEDFLGGKSSIKKFCAESLPSSGAPMKEADMKSLFD